MNGRGYKIALVLTAAAAAASILLAAWAIYGRFDQSTLNTHAIQELCGQGTTLRDVVIGGIAVVHAELQDPNVPEATHVADRKFLARFRGDLRSIDFLLNNPHSACSQATP